MPFCRSVGLGLLAFLACLIGLAGPAIAQSSAQGEPPQGGLDSVYACTEIADNGARLACFDAAAAALRSAEAEGAIKLIDLGTAQQLDRESFGFSLPSVNALLAPKKAARVARFAPIDRIESVIQAIRFAPGGAAVLTLENGQIWRQTDGERPYALKIGKNVRIAKGFGGGFLLTVGSSNLYRVRREQ